MLLKALPLLLVIATALTLKPVQSNISEGRTLMDKILQTSALKSEITVGCFNYYLPTLNEMSNKYDNDVIDCKENSVSTQI